MATRRDSPTPRRDQVQASFLQSIFRWSITLITTSGIVRFSVELLRSRLAPQRVPTRLNPPLGPPNGTILQQATSLKAAIATLTAELRHDYLRAKMASGFASRPQVNSGPEVVEITTEVCSNVSQWAALTPRQLMVGIRTR